jgi:hypothetical protein
LLKNVKENKFFIPSLCCVDRSSITEKIVQIFEKNQISENISQYQIVIINQSFGIGKTFLGKNLQYIYHNLLFKKYKKENSNSNLSFENFKNINKYTDFQKNFINAKYFLIDFRHINLTEESILDSIKIEGIKFNFIKDLVNYVEKKKIFIYLHFDEIHGNLYENNHIKYDKRNKKSL